MPNGWGDKVARKKKDKDPQNRSRMVFERPVAPLMDKRGRMNPYDPRLSPFSKSSRGQEIKGA
jgi:hypothetical protein